MSMDNILKNIASIQQSRSNFELINFVLGQHDTPEMAFYQLSLELQDLIYKVKHAELEIKKMSIVIDRLLNSSDELDRITAEQNILSRNQTQVALDSTKRELDFLLSVWDSVPEKYTRAQIEDNQATYWEQRLSRQAGSQAIGQGFVDMAQIDALRQIGALEKFIQDNAIKIPNNFNEIE